MSLTGPQRNALHLYCQHVADALNDAGYDMKVVLTHTAVSIPWNKMLVKEALLRSIQKAMFQKKSTEDLTNNELTELYEVLNRHLGEIFGIHVPWPHHEENNETIRPSE